MYSTFSTKVILYNTNAVSYTILSVINKSLFNDVIAFFVLPETSPFKTSRYAYFTRQNCQNNLANFLISFPYLAFHPQDIVDVATLQHIHKIRNLLHRFLVSAHTQVATKKENNISVVCNGIPHHEIND